MFCRAVCGRSLTKLPNKDMIDASEFAIVDADLRGAKIQLPKHDSNRTPPKYQQYNITLSLLFYFSDLRFLNTRIHVDIYGFCCRMPIRLLPKLHFKILLLTVKLRYDNVNIIQNSKVYFKRNYHEIIP